MRFGAEKSSLAAGRVEAAGPSRRAGGGRGVHLTPPLTGLRPWTSPASYAAFTFLCLNHRPGLPALSPATNNPISPACGVPTTAVYMSAF